jgi:hypothetical protein
MVIEFDNFKIDDKFDNSRNSTPININQQNDFDLGTDASETFAGAQAIPGAKAYNGELAGGADINDWAKFYVWIANSKMYLRLAVPPIPYDWDLYLYDASQTLINSSTKGAGQPEIIDHTFSSTGWYYIRIFYNSAPGSGVWGLNMNYYENDFNLGVDAAADFSGAQIISIGAYSGAFMDENPNEHDDWVKFNVPGIGYYIYIEKTDWGGISDDLDIYLYDPSYNLKDSSESNADFESLFYQADSSGYWYYRIYRYSGCGSYSGSISVYQNDFNLGTDASDTISSAQLISPGSYTGYLPTTSDNDDYIKFNVPYAGYGIYIEMSDGGSTNFDISLYNPSQVQVASSASGSDTEIISFLADSAGNWYLRINRYSGTGSYSCSIWVGDNDFNLGTDASNSLSGAQERDVGSYAGGFPTTGDFDDFVKFNVLYAGEAISVIMTDDASGNFDIELYDPSQSFVTYSQSTGDVDSFVYVTDAAGYWYLRIHPTTGTGKYACTISIGPNDFNLGMDASNLISGAQVISPGFYLGGLISALGDIDDWVKFNVSYGGYGIQLNMSDGSADFFITLYDPFQNPIISNPSFISYVADTSGDWYLRISIGSGTGRYNCSIWVGDNDFGLKMDAPNSVGSAQAVTPGSYYGGFPTSSDTEDCVKFTVPYAGYRIFIDMTDGATGDFNIYLYNPSQIHVINSTSSSDYNYISYYADAPGDWYLRINRSSGTGKYICAISVWEDDFYLNTDAANTIASAQTVTPGGYYGGFPTTSDTFDYVKFIIPYPGYGIYIVMTDESSMNFDIYLFNSSQIQVAYSASGGDTEYIRYIAECAGNWYLLIHRFSGSGKYFCSIWIGEDDFYLVADASNTISSAQTVSPGIYSAGIPTTADSDDFIKFIVPYAGYGIIIEMFEGVGRNFDLHLFDPSQILVSSSTNLGDTERISYIADIVGEWYIDISRSSGVGKYICSISIRENDFELLTDAADNLSDAQEIYSDWWAGGFPVISDLNDCVKLYVPYEGYGIIINMTDKPSNNFDIYLYNPSQILIDFSITDNDTEYISYFTDISGYWYLRINRKSGIGKYDCPIFIGENDFNLRTDAADYLNIAQEVLPGSWYGCFAYALDFDDCVKFNVPFEGYGILISMFDGPLSDFDLFLYNPNLVQVASSINLIDKETISFVTDMTGYWYLDISRCSVWGKYNCSISLNPNDFNLGTDAGNNLSSAQMISTGSFLGGLSTIDDIADCLKFTVPYPTYKIIITMSDDISKNFDIYLYNPTQIQAALSATENDNEEIIYIADCSGNWYLKILRISNLGRYNCSIVVNQNDFNLGMDASNNISDSPEVFAGNYSGVLIKNDDPSDWIKFYLPTAGYRIEIIIVDEPGARIDFDLFLFNSNQSFIISSTSSYDTDLISYIIDAPGYWYLKITSFNGNGNYTLKISLISPQSGWTQIGNEVIFIIIIIGILGIVQEPAKDSMVISAVPEDLKIVKEAPVISEINLNQITTNLKFAQSYIFLSLKKIPSDIKLYTIFDDIKNEIEKIMGTLKESSVSAKELYQPVKKPAVPSEKTNGSFEKVVVRLILNNLKLVQAKILESSKIAPLDKVLSTELDTIQNKINEIKEALKNYFL